MKKETLTTLLLFFSIVLVGLFGYFAGTRQQEQSTINPLDHEVDSLMNYSNNKEVEFKKKVDSVSIENRALKNANTTIEKSITKLLKQNEKNKASLMVLSDSTKYFIIDSLLKRSGYR